MFGAKWCIIAETHVPVINFLTNLAKEQLTSEGQTQHRVIEHFESDTEADITALLHHVRLGLYDSILTCFSELNVKSAFWVLRTSHLQLDDLAEWFFDSFIAC